MSFGTPIFLFIFLPAVFLIHSALSSAKARNLFLAAASLIFFCFGQLSALPALCISILLNYVAGKMIATRENGQKTILTVTVVLNLLILCFFKYTVFLLENINQVFSCNFATPQILLPIGISFFTFQGLSYVIDIYRGDAEPAEGLCDFALFVMFFPQFLMGPIIEWRDAASQMRTRSAEVHDVAQGFRRFCFGLFKNTVIAGTMGKIADTVYNGSVAGAVGLIDARLAWLGVICYAFELYFDFSGYSDMALGLSRVFGFHFKENFDFPYASDSIRDFWRRWHISLSTWFRDYVYFPLGGSRKGKGRAFLNRMAVFLLTGIWHGANWTFLVWGVLHGLLSNLEDIGVIPVKRLEKTGAGKVLNRIYAFLAVVILFAIFRADSLKDSWTVVASLFAGGIRTNITGQLLQLLTPFAVFIMVLAFLTAGPLVPALRKRLSGFNGTAAMEGSCYALAFALAMFSIWYLSQGNFSPSIYMQF